MSFVYLSETVASGLNEQETIHFTIIFLHPAGGDAGDAAQEKAAVHRHT